MFFKSEYPFCSKTCEFTKKFIGLLHTSKGIMQSSLFNLNLIFFELFYFSNDYCCLNCKFCFENKKTIALRTRIPPRARKILGTFSCVTPPPLGQNHDPNPASCRAIIWYKTFLTVHAPPVKLHVFSHVVKFLLNA